MLARRALHTLVNVFGAVDALVAGRTRARILARHRARVANGVRMARIRGARIRQMAQQPRIAAHAIAVERSNAVDACGPVEARRAGTIVNVHATIGPRPAVHADARVAAVHIGARRSILAHRRPGQALVHIVLTVFAVERARALATVRVDAVDACAAVLAQIAGTIVDIIFTVDTLEACTEKEWG